jgi:hypothetical protein
LDPAARRGGGDRQRSAPPPLLGAAGATGSAPLLLRSFLFGWNVSVAGAFIGAMWAFAWGFLLGAGFAFVYNLAVVPPAPPPFDWDAEPDGEG